jgi:hypothetical protein
MSAARAGSSIRFTLFVNPYQRKYYRSYDKPLPLVLMTFKEKIVVTRVPYKRASSSMVKARLPSGTVQSVGTNTVTVKDAMGNLYVIKQVQGASYSAGQTAVMFRKGFLGPEVFAI